MMQVTKDLGLAYDFAKRRAGEMFTAEQLAVGAKIKLASAQRLSMFLAELRIFNVRLTSRPRRYELVVPHLPENEARIRAIEDELRMVILPDLRRVAQEAQDIRASEPAAYPQYEPMPDRRSHRRHPEDEDEPPDGATGAPGPSPAPGSGGPANQNEMPASEVPGSNSGPRAKEAPGMEALAGESRPSFESGMGTIAPQSGTGAHTVSAALEQRSSAVTRTDLLEETARTHTVDRPPISLIPAKEQVRVLFEMIRRPEGATLEELASTLGNQPHTVRATISVKSREQGLSVECVRGRYFLHHA